MAKNYINREEAEKDAKETAERLTTEKGFSVSYMVLQGGKDKNDFVLMYLQNPSREAKRTIMDEIMKSPTSAGRLYIECALLKEDSDPRVSSSLAENDAIVMGAELACVPLIELYQTDIKKK